MPIKYKPWDLEKKKENCTSVKTIFSFYFIAVKNLRLYPRFACT